MSRTTVVSLSMGAVAFTASKVKFAGFANGPFLMTVESGSVNRPGVAGIEKGRRQS